MPFTSLGGDLKNIFITEADIIDRFVGNQLWGAGNQTASNPLLGDNTTTFRPSPVQTIAGGLNWSKVSAGFESTGAIKTDGTLWTWGYGGRGGLGQNSTQTTSSPIQTIGSANNWCSVSMGHRAGLGLKTDGTLWLWGYNNRGQLGTNSVIYRSSPVQTISGGINWKEAVFSKGGFGGFVGAIKTDGTLWMWGKNEAGNLGNNNLLNRSSPVQTISGGTNWKQVSAGTSTAGAIKTDGTLWVWGCNYVGQLGNYNRVSQSSPVQTIGGGTNWKQLSLGCELSGAIKTDGTLWIWGQNFAGGLGLNNRTLVRSSPVQTIAGGANWKTISVGYSVAAIKTDGTLWLWGSGNQGMGDGVARSSPTQITNCSTSWKNVDVNICSSFFTTFTS
jgi:alpha-tubulin suppressor-like RCC1 family protein